MNNTYPMAYVEVLTLLKYYLKEEDYNKIPKEKIEFFEKNADSEYKYRIDKSKPYAKQEISKKANSIIVSLYRDYFVTPEEKRILDQILVLNDLNQKKIQAYEEGEAIKEKLVISVKEENIGGDVHIEPKENKEETALLDIEKESIWMKIINKIRRKLSKV